MVIVGSHSSPEWHQKRTLHSLSHFGCNLPSGLFAAGLGRKESWGRQIEMVRTQERLRAGGLPYWGRAGHRPEAAYLVARGIEYALARNTVNGFLERELTQIDVPLHFLPLETRSTGGKQHYGI